jgi:polyhydroxybutyrate depolymerase
MTVRKALIGAALILIGLPVLLVQVAMLAVSLANRTNGSIIVSGVRREYLLYVPRNYDRARPVPLVISLHGAMNWPAYQMKISQWNRVADEHGFIVVYPAGTGRGPRAWFMEGAEAPARMPDVRFISDLIDTLEAQYTIDPARIYANGLSNGGGMAFVLSCTLSRRIAAIGAVSAAQSLPWSWCTDSTAVPMITFHGSADPLVPYGGAPPGWLNPEAFPAVRTWTAAWAARNRCRPDPVDSAVAPDVSRLEYLDCASNAAVELYTIQGAGHQWPGGKAIPRWLAGPTRQSINATEIMWEFFREHPRPGP